MIDRDVPHQLVFASGANGSNGSNWGGESPHGRKTGGLHQTWSVQPYLEMQPGMEWKILLARSVGVVLEAKDWLVLGDCRWVLLWV